MPMLRLINWLTRWRGGWGLNRELNARAAYLAARRDDMAAALVTLDPDALEELSARLSLIHYDLAAGRTKDAALALNETDEQVAVLERLMQEAASEHEAHAARVESLRRLIASCRARLAALYLAGIGKDGLAMLEARLVHAEKNTSRTALPTSEAEIAAVERALNRLAERSNTKLTHS
jgi:chromosome segregation ATPase